MISSLFSLSTLALLCLTPLSSAMTPHLLAHSSSASPPEEISPAKLPLSALSLGEIVVAQQGRPLLLKSWARQWWAARKDHKASMPRDPHPMPEELLSPYSTPLALYLHLTLPLDGQEELRYIALPSEIAQLGYRGKDASERYLNYRELRALISSLGEEFVEMTLAAATLEELEQSAGQGSSLKEHYRIEGAHLLPRAGRAAIKGNSPFFLWLRQKLGWERIGARALSLKKLRNFQSPLTNARAKALKNLLERAIAHEQLTQTDSSSAHLLALPSKTSSATWYSLHLLSDLQLAAKRARHRPSRGEDSSLFSLLLYQNELLKPIKEEASLAPSSPALSSPLEAWEKIQEQPGASQAYIDLSDSLIRAYDEAQKQATKHSSHSLDLNSSSSLPSLFKLQWADRIESLPIELITIILWSLLLVPLLGPKRLALFHLAYLWLSLLLLARILILHRPPVSNMYETLLYVPWVVATLSYLIERKKPQSKVLLRSSTSALVVISALFTSAIEVDRTFAPTIAVLDSSFWLATHVLLVVGSYGALLLASVLSHVDLLRMMLLYFRGDQEETKMLATWTKRSATSRQVARSLIEWGTSALIFGTLLGGVWAAQSWGRFWDWDPKESWALISSAYYLILIHRLWVDRCAPALFSLMSATGALFITFTWYGVNYILGVGLHSYGFGAGSHMIYYSYVLLELLFLCGSFLLYYRLKGNAAPLDATH